MIKNSLIDNNSQQKLSSKNRLDKCIPVVQENLTGSQQEGQNELKNERKLSINDDFGIGEDHIGSTSKQLTINAYFRINEDHEKWSFEQLSEHYQKTSTICRSWRLGVKFRFSQYEKLTSPEGLKYRGKYKGHKIHEVNCNKFTCDRCRRTVLKQRLKREIQRVMEEKELYQHIVITTEGYDKYRKDHDYRQSYKDMQIAWNKIRGRLSYIAKKKGLHLSFIQMPRAQKNGYCHPHVVTNLKISQRCLQNIVNKYVNTGSARVTTHAETAKYLTDDFLKDHEFYIPIGQKHYTTSKDIKLNIYKKVSEDTEDSSEKGEFSCEFIHILPKPIPENELHIFLNPDSRKNIIDQLHDIIDRDYGYPLPFEIMLAEFYWMVHKT